MAANVEYVFNKYFELDEEKLRRIHAIIKKRVNEKNQSDIEFLVKRIDNLVFITKNIDDIINETNDSTSKIQSIFISIKNDEQDLQVELSHRDGAALSLSGEDRDNVFLLSSELKEYISKEVANKRSLSWLQSRFILPFTMVIFVAYCMYVVSAASAEVSVTLEQALHTSNIDEKLNYLILKASKSSESYKLLPALLIMFTLLMLQLLPISKVLNILFPKNTFLFGKEIQTIERKKKLASNIFWGVIVAGVLSAVIAYITKLFN